MKGSRDKKHDFHIRIVSIFVVLILIIFSIGALNLMIDIRSQEDSGAAEETEIEEENTGNKNSSHSSRSHNDTANKSNIA